MLGKSSLKAFVYRLYESSRVARKRLQGKRAFDRYYFESLFRLKRDPWRYQSEHQQERLSLLLRSIPHTQGSVLELGCAEGMFSRLLQERFSRVVAVDISRTALQRAKNVAQNVQFVQADVLHLPFQKKFKVIVCAGILGYLPERQLFETAAMKITDILSQGGHLILEHMWNGGGGALKGSQIHNYFLENFQLMLTDLVRHKEYGISVFQK